MNLPTASLSKIGSKLELTKFAGVASPVLAIIVSILIAFFVVRPKFSEVLRLQTANDELAIRADALGDKAAALASLDKDQLEKYLNAAEALLPSEKGVFGLIGQVELAAQASGVLLTRLDVNPGVLTPGAADKSSTPGQAAQSGQANEAEGAAQKIQMRVSIGSDYNSFLQFLNNLFTAPRVIAVKDLTVASTSSDSSQLKASMVVEAYWQDLPKELPSIESPVANLDDAEIKLLENVRTTPQTQTSEEQISDVPIGRSDLFAPF